MPPDKIASSSIDRPYPKVGIAVESQVQEDLAGLGKLSALRCAKIGMIMGEVMS
jgi:hypothetical protein